MNTTINNPYAITPFLDASVKHSSTNVIQFGLASLNSTESINGTTENRDPAKITGIIPATLILIGSHVK